LASCLLLVPFAVIFHNIYIYIELRRLLGRKGKGNREGFPSDVSTLNRDAELP
jgi:hypothetical protein